MRTDGWPPWPLFPDDEPTAEIPLETMQEARERQRVLNASKATRDIRTGAAREKR